ncbi:hypothetical protein CC2G_003674 [Coprinopsis cinerea AmutBmut pab1-1]|nr:hypothetical protein CC2G_003674 [Coprinopsis cinerea AmutBmut pab1-1]
MCQAPALANGDAVWSTGFHSPWRNGGEPNGHRRCTSCSFVHRGHYAWEAILLIGLTGIERRLVVGYYSLISVL